MNIKIDYFEKKITCTNVIGNMPVLPDISPWNQNVSNFFCRMIVSPFLKDRSLKYLILHIKQRKILTHKRFLRFVWFTHTFLKLKWTCEPNNVISLNIILLTFNKFIKTLIINILTIFIYETDNFLCVDFKKYYFVITCSCRNFEILTFNAPMRYYGNFDFALCNNLSNKNSLL